MLAQYTYDPPGHLGRLAARTAYDDAGQPVVTLHNEAYDALGRVLAQTWTFATGEVFRLGFQYNAANDLVAITYPGGPHGESGETVTYTYLGRQVYRMEGNGPAGAPTIYIQSTTLDAAGHPLSRTLGDRAFLQRWTYEAGTMRLVQLRVTSAQGTASSKAPVTCLACPPTPEPPRVFLDSLILE